MAANSRSANGLTVTSGGCSRIASRYSPDIRCTAAAIVAAPSTGTWSPSWTGPAKVAGAARGPQPVNPGLRLQPGDRGHRPVRPFRLAVRPPQRSVLDLRDRLDVAGSGRPGVPVADLDLTEPGIAELPAGGRFPAVRRKPGGRVRRGRQGDEDGGLRGHRGPGTDQVGQDAISLAERLAARNDPERSGRDQRTAGPDPGPHR